MCHVHSLGNVLYQSEKTRCSTFLIAESAEGCGQAEQKGVAKRKGV